MTKTPKLIVFSGLPATGKSSLAWHLAQTLQIPMFSKDYFESVLYEDHLSDGRSLSGYHLLLETTKLQLSLGLSVVVDAVFPLQGFRDSILEIAREHHAKLYLIHTFCSDESVHQKRLLERPIHVPWNPVDWARVQEIASFYVPWTRNEALFLDAVDTFEHNFQQILAYIEIKEVLLNCLNDYAGEAENGYSYLTANLDQTLFTIVSIGDYKGKHISFTDLIVRRIDDKIVIEEDRNSDPLYEALVQAGIPREQIILAYAGESIPNTA